MERLNFELPDFTRYSWASDHLRIQWQPRIKSMIKVWQAIEMMSVTERIRTCGLIITKISEFEELRNKFVKDGFDAVPLQKLNPSRYPYSNNLSASQTQENSHYRIVIGYPESIKQFREYWINDDHDEIGKMLGYPSCCRDFFKDVWIKQKFIDTTWQMALNTVKVEGAPNYVEVIGSPETNILWRWVGLRMVPHLPCSFNCIPSISFSTKLIELGKKMGHSEALNLLEEVLSWSVEWSALHGIAEIKTPLLKVSTKTDATGKKYVVRCIGKTSISQSNNSIAFPNVSFNPQKIQPWYYNDNGFSSYTAMERAHKPLIDIVKSICNEEELCNVLDLGCGNALLLKNIKGCRPNITPFGIDVDPIRIEHAKLLLPNYKENFFNKDIFEQNSIWEEDLNFKVIILMPGRFLEYKDLKKIKWLKNMVFRKCNNLVVYAYGDWLTKYITIDKLAAEAGFTVQPVDKGCTVGISRLYKPIQE